jgi:hypothetical protein
MVQAWQTAALVGAAMAGKLPSLPNLLAKLRPAPKHLPHASLAQLSTHLGIPMRPASPEALAALERLEARAKDLHG